MPNISIEDARVLKDLLRMSRPPNRSSLPDIEELHNLIQRDRLENLTRTSPSVVKKAKEILALSKKPRKKETLSPMIEAARTKTIQVELLYPR
jgi:preprotein translocase subunit Sss1